MNESECANFLLSGGEAIKILLTVLMGAFLTYFIQSKLKKNEIKNSSLSNAHYLGFLLTQQRGSLEKINRLIEMLNTGQKQKMYMRPSEFHIKQEAIEKILAYQEFNNHFYASAIQGLMSFESTYQDCFELVDNYNKVVDKALELQVLPQQNEATQALLEGCKIEIESYSHNIKKKYAEALSLHAKTKKHFDILCENVFKKEYMPIETKEIVETTELLKEYGE